MEHSFSTSFLDIQCICKTAASDTLFFIVGSVGEELGGTLIGKIAKARKAVKISL